jgi:nitrite reductase/ring-hydroxylating ferredoxin subunit
MSQDDDDFRYVCRTDQVPEGQSREFSISDDDGRAVDVAIFNIDGRFYAISNVCVPRVGRLARGSLTATS